MALHPCLGHFGTTPLTVSHYALASLGVSAVIPYLLCIGRSSSLLTHQDLLRHLLLQAHALLSTVILKTPQGFRWSIPSYVALRSFAAFSPSASKQLVGRTVAFRLLAHTVLYSPPYRAGGRYTILTISAVQDLSAAGFIRRWLCSTQCCCSLLQRYRSSHRLASKATFSRQYQSVHSSCSGNG